MAGIGLVGLIKRANGEAATEELWAGIDEGTREGIPTNVWRALPDAPQSIDPLRPVRGSEPATGADWICREAYRTNIYGNVIEVPEGARVGPSDPLVTADPAKWVRAQ